MRKAKSPLNGSLNLTEINMKFVEWYYPGKYEIGEIWPNDSKPYEQVFCLHGRGILVPIHFLTLNLN